MTGGDKLNGELWIEFGAGWAKVHFRRDVTDLDRANLEAALGVAAQAAPKPDLEALADGIVREMHSVLTTKWDRDCLRAKALNALYRASAAALPSTSRDGAT